MPTAPRRFRVIFDGQSLSTARLHHTRSQLPKDRLPLARPRLTPREIEVLTLIARGDAYAHVAHRLSISEDMAKFHIEKARRKLNAKNKTHAAVIAATEGLLKL